MCVELRLQRLLVLLAIRAIARALGTEGYRGTNRAVRLDRNVGKPFGNADCGPFHLPCLARRRSGNRTDQFWRIVSKVRARRPSLEAWRARHCFARASALKRTPSCRGRIR